MKIAEKKRIYVACMAAYNCGKLHGEWIELDNKSEDEVNAEIESILKSSPEQGALNWEVRRKMDRIREAVSNG